MFEQVVVAAVSFRPKKYELVGKGRRNSPKMQITEGYRPSWWFNRLGDSNRSLLISFGPCGFLICKDRWNLDLARIPVLDGAR